MASQINAALDPGRSTALSDRFQGDATIRAVTCLSVEARSGMELLKRLQEGLIAKGSGGTDGA
jgi:hypothetical protein